MAEMEDYSGEFKHDFQFSDLSKQALVRIVEAYQRIFQGFSVVALDVLQKEIGKEEAQRVFNEIYWREMERFAVPLVRKALKIKDSDVISMFKYFQVAPDGCRGGGMYEFDFDVKSKNDVGYVGKFCQNAAYYEKAGDKEGMDRLCASGPGSFEHNAYEIICKLFHPDMKMEWPLLPPRADKSGPFCRWRFTIDEKAEKKG
jgi:hypothetical protein